ncbi:type II toxin-antitoxin system VapC family toxin [Haloarchaeobius iranensis]|uniref:Ribonuclease VapC n=1 Tax=Haloarchaeobius iranensis TaxID=996166 RepID=A0A1G9ZW55_9EURY|nr:PIN domain-containing protein [Haloarchaeobius iranensis]SDN25649.1 PIN domain-containing protein [Haloarchaeobius iranensis]
MTVVVDTDVFLAALVADGEHGEVAREFLNRDEEFATSTLTMLELQAILVDEAGMDAAAVRDACEDIVDGADVYEADMDDFGLAKAMRDGTDRGEELSNNDWTLLAMAADLGADLVTFDERKQAQGAVAPHA